MVGPHFSEVSPRFPEKKLVKHHFAVKSRQELGWRAYIGVIPCLDFTEVRFTEVSEFTYLGKHFVCVNVI